MVPFDTSKLLAESAVVEAKPPHVMLGVVPPDEMIGHVPVTDVTVPLPLLLNVVQSVDERQPACEPDAV